MLYTHRSNYLHTLRALQADAMALTGSDVVLVAVPMFHANGWGLPFAAPAVGRQAGSAGPPRRRREPRAASMRDEGVTVAVGVQTVWLGVLDHLDADGGELPALKRMMIGGSNCPDALIRRMEERLGAAGADQLGHDRAVARWARSRRPTRAVGARALPAGRRWAST